MNTHPWVRWTCFVTLWPLLAGCVVSTIRPATHTQQTETPAFPTSAATRSTFYPPTTTAYETGDGEGEEGLTKDQENTLRSLDKVDDFPLYTMQYFGSYPAGSVETSLSLWANFKDWFRKKPMIINPMWGCSLFAALGDEENRLYGRNFDWQYSPALFLFSDPPNGYASVSMVDIEYLGFTGSTAKKLMELPLSERAALLRSPWLPFDGMNEHGLVVGMAAVPPGEMHYDPQKETVGSLEVIRAILDQAKEVNEAIEIFNIYNVDMVGGPPIHYLVADRSGAAALVEFYRGQMVVIPNQAPWHQATNFLVASTGEKSTGWCWRYDRINTSLSERQGRFSNQVAMDLLEQVSQNNTQWSVVYNLTKSQVYVVINKQYDKVYEFAVKP